MGFAIADAAAALGADVTVIAANVELKRSGAIRYIDVETAEQLHAACLGEFPRCELLVMAAAVADFRPASPESGKHKKDGVSGLTIELEPTVDTLSALSAERRPGQTLVGFAAEHGTGAIAYGRDKLQRKGLDAIVVNDVSLPGIGFDSSENEVTIISAGGERTVPRASKEAVAREILADISRLL
jgi:phosphopantothenoylcysteine decarboxylase/phosphopantothenate--cysteine ligase